jgi:hypothetical protein
MVSAVFAAGAQKTPGKFACREVRVSGTPDRNSNTLKVSSMEAADVNADVK